MPAKTTTWTRLGADPTLFDAADNWDNGVAVDGDTIDASSGTAPTANRPTTGTFHFSITNAVEPTISSFLNGAAIGDVTVNAGAIARCTSDITGNVVVTSGYLRPMAAITISGTTDIAVAGTLNLNGNVTAVGEVTLAGTLALSGSILDCSVPLRVTASTAVVYWAGGEIDGGFNAAGFPVAHALAGGETLTCDVAGTLDLGTTDANAIAVTAIPATGAITIGASFACGGFTMQGNVLCATARTITVGAGGATYVSGTKTGVLNITMAVNANIAWGSASARIDTMTINPGVVGTLYVDSLRCSAFAGSGTIVTGADTLAIYAAANDFWLFSGICTATSGFVDIRPAANLSNTAPIVVAGGTTYIRATSSNYGLTATGGFSCATLTFLSGGLVLPNGATISGAISGAGKITFGEVVKLGANVTLAGIVPTFGAASLKFTATGKVIDGASATTPTSKGAHVHGGAIQNLAVTAANPVYHFGRNGAADSGNGAGVIEMPSPLMNPCMAA